MTETHREFRKILIDKELSMQEAFQKFSELAVMGDRRAQKILDELSREKREFISKDGEIVIDARNVDNIYDIIESNNSFEDEDD